MSTRYDRTQSNRPAPGLSWSPVTQRPPVPDSSETPGLGQAQGYFSGTSTTEPSAPNAVARATAGMETGANWTDGQENPPGTRGSAASPPVTPAVERGPNVTHLDVVEPAGNGSTGSAATPRVERFTGAQHGASDDEDPGRRDNEDEDEDTLSRITGRMAKLQRDPSYARLHRILAARRRRRARLTELTLALDLTLTLSALVLAQHYRVVLSQILPIYLYVHVFGVSDTLVLGGLVILIWPLIFSRFGLYQPSWIADRFSPLRVLAAVLASSLVASGILYFLYADRTRWFMLCFTALDTLVLASLRLILRPLAASRSFRRRVLIVGTGRVAVDAARAVAARRRQGMELVGMVGPERPPLTEPAEFDEWTRGKYRAWTPPRLGEIEEAPQLVRDSGIDLILIALTPHERQAASWVVSSMASLPVQVYVVPDVTAETAKTTVDALDGMPIVGLSESAIAGWALRVKRLIDLAICLPLVLLLWPLLLIIALAIRLDSPGPALFRQERVGQHNRRFTIYKFRTMYVDAEERARTVAVRTEAGELVHKQRGDPRVTRVGALLRRTSLDELPQVLNVLKGDMSVVGPRPEMPWIVERYRAWQYRRLLVPQGITGWWQVHGRSDRILHLHTQDDIYYVRNYSLRLDLKILLMTIKAVLTGKGAF